jgi:hypothetical protein
MKRKITFKPLGPEDVWHPKSGPPFGSRNALKTGLHGREIRDLKRRIAVWRRAVRAALAGTVGVGNTSGSPKNG